MGYKKTDPCIKKAYDDERLFVLMARDPEAPRTIVHWISRSLATQPREKLHEALDAALEMQMTAPGHQMRKEEEKKDAIAAKERDEFNAWKKRQERATIIRDAERGPEITGIEEAGTISAAWLEQNFARNFARWLDAQGPHIKEKEYHPHTFAILADEFIKSVPNR